jgi:hypothetical protein
MDDEGVINKGKDDEFIDGMFPADLAKRIKEEVGACTTKFSNLRLNSTDVRCRAFKPLIHCIMRADAKVFWDGDGDGDSKNLNQSQCADPPTII